MDQSSGEFKLTFSLRLVLNHIGQGRRGIPLSHAAVTDHAAAISGTDIGADWINNFKKRHPDLRIRWTSSLEECRARALTPDVVGKLAFPVCYCSCN